jgi:hypothetical protein
MNVSLMLFSSGMWNISPWSALIISLALPRTDNVSASVVDPDTGTQRSGSRGFGSGIGIQALSTVKSF